MKYDPPAQRVSISNGQMEVPSVYAFIITSGFLLGLYCRYYPALVVNRAQSDRMKSSYSSIYKELSASFAYFAYPSTSFALQLTSTNPPTCSLTDHIHIQEMSLPVPGIEVIEL